MCHLYTQTTPNYRTIRDREALLRPATLALINRRVVRVGQARGVTRGEKLRVDGSVTETDIHYPTDSSLLDDGARVPSRLLTAARALMQPGTPEEKSWYHDRHRQAHNLARQISRLARPRKGERRLAADDVENAGKTRP